MPRGALAEIAALDPLEDYARICFLSTNYDFPWDVEQSLSLAFFKTYAIPSISALLDRTGEFRARAQKRYDDTKLILAELLDSGLDSEPGREANRRMNRMHGRYAIANDDHLYVLSTLVLEPIRWNRRWGWRRYTESEKRASLEYMREVARRMNVRDVPPTVDALERWSVDYERTHFRFTESNRRVADQTLGLFASWYPRLLRPLVRAEIISLLERPLREAFGYSDPPPVLGGAIDIAMRARAALLRFMPRRSTPRLVSRTATPSYPRGHSVGDLGIPGLDAKPAGPTG